MNGTEYLLNTLAMAVFNMRQCQETWKQYRTDKNQRAMEACEREVDELVALRLAPAPLKESTNAQRS